MRKLFPALFLMCAASLPAAKNLEIYCIDVEGGQATLVISPSGESLLVDTGYPGFNRRDAGRILAAAKAAGVKRIDYLVITHYHQDHVGGVPQLAEKIPIRNFVDHGANAETTKDASVLFNAYSAFREKGTHIQAKPGDTLPMKGIEVRFLSSNGEVLSAPLAGVPGAGQPNPDCTGYQPPAPDTTENGRSLGMLITYGDFRMLDLGDLSSEREYGLVCPANKIGTAALFLVSHHGSSGSDSAPLVHAIHPRVAIMNNGARKGGAPEVWQTVHDTPGLEDFWQLHFAVAAGKAHNTPDTFIANVDEICEGKWLRVDVQRDGAFSVYNSRNKYAKSYGAK
ncbi:MAG: MBL fold metallo-hydrolase [Acidobacteriia bacterium]|nr:MBL fold metallo-hydrolase [Terriglobia bacterium]